MIASVCSESIQPLAINVRHGISLQNFVISFENAINHEQCRSSMLSRCSAQCCKNEACSLEMFLGVFPLFSYGRWLRVSELNTTPVNNLGTFGLRPYSYISTL